MGTSGTGALQRSISESGARPGHRKRNTTHHHSRIISLVPIQHRLPIEIDCNLWERANLEIQPYDLFVGWNGTLSAWNEIWLATQSYSCDDGREVILVYGCSFCATCWEVVTGISLHAEIVCFLQTTGSHTVRLNSILALHIRPRTVSCQLIQMYSNPGDSLSAR